MEKSVGVSEGAYATAQQRLWGSPPPQIENQLPLNPQVNSKFQKVNCPNAPQFNEPTGSIDPLDMVHWGN